MNHDECGPLVETYLFFENKMLFQIISASYIVGLDIESHHQKKKKKKKNELSVFTSFFFSSSS